VGEDAFGSWAIGCDDGREPKMRVRKAKCVAANTKTAEEIILISWSGIAPLRIVCPCGLCLQAKRVIRGFNRVLILKHYAVLVLS
jgi:hypothetical protein